MTPGKTRPIVVVGSINMDMVSNAQRIPAAGETVLGSDFQLHPGGKGANQAVAVSRLGCPVQLVGMLGSDVFGDQLRAHLQSASVDVTAVGVAKSSSGTASIIVAPGGENCIVVTPAANSEVSPEYLDSHASIIREAAFVLTQLEIPIETVEHLADMCFQHNVPLILDPAPARALSPKLLGRIKWFTPNETEAAFFMRHAAHSTNAETARSLLALGPAGVILKLGSRGADLATDKYEQQVKAMPVNAIDTTAAGDCFNGAFAAGLTMGVSLEDSLKFAVTAASISVTRPGAQPSMPTLAEVEEALKNG